jgi:hypothetical protein
MRPGFDLSTAKKNFLDLLGYNLWAVTFILFRFVVQWVLADGWSYRTTTIIKIEHFQGWRCGSSGSALLCKHEALSSNSSTAKKEKKRKEKKNPKQQQQKNQNISSPQKVPLSSSVNHCCPLPSALATTDWLCVPFVFPFWECHVSQIILYVAFCLWLPLLSFWDSSMSLYQ